jgi:hypothetical protein
MLIFVGEFSVRRQRWNLYIDVSYEAHLVRCSGNVISQWLDQYPAIISWDLMKVPVRLQSSFNTKLCRTISIDLGLPV